MNMILHNKTNASIDFYIKWNMQILYQIAVLISSLLAPSSIGLTVLHNDLNNGPPLDETVKNP